MSVDHPVTLRVLARPELAPVVRLTTLSVALDVGFDVDELQDLKLAVDRVFVAATAAVGDEATSVELELYGDDRGLIVEGRAERSVPSSIRLDDASGALVSIAFDECDLELPGSGLFFLRKQPSRR